MLANINKMKMQLWKLYITFFLLMVCAGLILQNQAFAGTQNMAQFGRIKINSTVQLESQYTDNVFLNEDDKQNDLITKVIPQVQLSYAIAPQNTLSVTYEGDFRHYINFDNFSKAHNHGEFLWQWEQPGGSKLSAGFNLDDMSIQPFSEQGQAKDYLQWQLYLDSIYKIGAFTEAGLRVDSSSREFDDEQWSIDDYKRYGLAFDMSYRRWEYTSLTFEYSYSHQDNEEFDRLSNDIDIHSLIAGPRWSTGGRLSGQLLGGYSKITGDAFSDNSGFSLNANLEYSYSDFTRFKLKAYRQFNSSTRAERETNSYNIATGAALTTEYSRWDPLWFIFLLSYKNQSFENQEYQYSDLFSDERVDDFYQLSIKTRYSIRQWMSIFLEYQYRQRDSNFETVEYKENRATLGLKFTM
jgi:hypothetical protein